MLKEMMKNNNTTFTANGAKSNATTGRGLLDFFALAGASRQKSDNELISMFEAAYVEDPQAATVLMFYFRDILEGQGERRLFRVLANHFAKKRPDVAKKLVHLVPEYGRWDDMYAFVDTPVESIAFDVMKKQWKEDLVSEYPSLLAKWLKGSNPKNIEGKYWMQKTYQYFGLSHKEYRKGLSLLRARLNVVEKLMSDQEWLKINYSHVPGSAMKRYFKAFLNNDNARFVEYLSLLKKANEGDVQAAKEVKVNAKTLFPHEIISGILLAGRPTAMATTLFDGQWKALPKYPLAKTLSVVDVSDSMEATISSNSRVTAMDVSIALGIITAQQNEGEFNNSFVTFSSDPQLVTLQGSNIVEIARNMSRANWNMSTNIQGVFDLVLNSAVRGRIPQSEMPERILIISDMQFNMATRSNRKTNYEVIKEKYRKAGYQMPQLVFWNVMAQPGKKEFPIVANDDAILVSGYSPVVLKYMYKNEVTSPLDMVYEVVKASRYSEVYKLFN